MNAQRTSTFLPSYYNLFMTTWLGHANQERNYEVQRVGNHPTSRSFGLVSRNVSIILGDASRISISSVSHLTTPKFHTQPPELHFCCLSFFSNLATLESRHAREISCQENPHWTLMIISDQFEGPLPSPDLTFSWLTMVLCLTLSCGPPGLYRQCLAHSFVAWEVSDIVELHV